MHTENKITTLFNNSSSTNLGGILESITYGNNICTQILCLCSDQSVNDVNSLSAYIRTTDVTWIILMMSLLRFWALIVLGSLLSMEGQRALGIHQKYLDLCSENKQRSYGLGTTWGSVNNDRFFNFGLAIPLNLNLFSHKKIIWLQKIWNIV